VQPSRSAAAARCPAAEPAPPHLPLLEGVDVAAGDVMHVARLCLCLDLLHSAGRWGAQTGGSNAGGGRPHAQCAACKILAACAMSRLRWDVWPWQFCHKACRGRICRVRRIMRWVGVCCKAQHPLHRMQLTKRGTQSSTAHTEG
jgi:hypothetical protein